MPTFIKPGFWREICNPCDGYEGWLNLDDLAGTAGSSGTSGTSGAVGPTGPQGVQGTQGIQGIQGIQGPQGETGAALTVLGSYPDLSAFYAGAGGSPGAPGTAWIIESDGSLYVWNTATNAWEDVGDLQGPAGPQGPQGIQGEQGLQGVQGIQGVAGTSGTSGSSGTSPVFPLPVVYGLFAQTGDSTPITNTTVETSLINGGVGTLTVGANQFTVGDSFRADFGGVISAGNNQTIRVKLKTGSVILADSGIQTLTSSITNDIWSLSVNFTIRQIGTAGVASIVSLGTFNYTKTNNGTVEGFSFNTVNNTTFDTTVGNTLDVTVQWGAASVLNTIYSDIFVLNKIY